MLKIRFNSKAAIFILFLLFEYKFLYLVELPWTLGATANSILVFTLSVLTFVFFLMKRKVPPDVQVRRFIMTVMVIQVVELIFTVRHYPEEPWFNGFKNILPLLTLLSCFYLSEYVRIDFKKFLNILIFFSTLGALLIWIQAMLYNGGYGSFLHIYGFNYGRDIDFRNLRVRILGSPLIDYTAYISIGLFFTKNQLVKKGYLIVNIVSVLLYNIFTSQTRATLLMIMVEVMFFLLFSKNRSIIIKIILITLGIGIVAWIISYIRLMTAQITTDYSLYHRLEEIEYYLQCFKRSPLFGNGLLSENPTTASLYYVVHGYKGFSYVDVGFIGDLGLYGTMGIIMYFQYYKTLYSFRINGKSNPLLKAIVVASVFSMISLSLFNGGRIFVLAVYLLVANASHDHILDHGQL